MCDNIAILCAPQARNIHIVEKLIRTNDLVRNARESKSRVWYRLPACRIAWPHRFDA